MNKKPGSDKADNAPQNVFTLRHISEVSFSTQANDFVEGLLFKNSLSLIYAPPGVGKSFFTLDLAASVATGAPWRGRDVERGGVLYVCLEGVVGFQRRIEALRRQGRISNEAAFYLLETPLSLCQAEEVEALKTAIMDQIEKSPVHIQWVIIDTLSRAMAGRDENNGEDMTAAIRNLGVIQETGAAVTIVHHPGKDTGRGARGHSSLLGAVDTEIALEKNKQSKVTTATVSKQKDAEEGQKFSFRLEVVTLGVDDKLRPITSCTVEHLAEHQVPETEPKVGRPPRGKPSDIRELFPDDGGLAPKELRDVVQKAFGVKLSASEKKIKTAVDGGLIRKIGGRYLPVGDESLL